MTFSDKPKVNLSVDPLGEIRKRATELWIENGGPSGTTWEDFFADAEEELIAGKSGNVPTQRMRSLDPKPVNQTPYCGDRAETLEQALHCVFGDTLSQHDSYCLAQILEQYSFVLKDQREMIVPSSEQIAIILAQLSLDYPVDLLKLNCVSSPAELSLAVRVQYWSEKISEWETKDEPLTLADRNTMLRLHESIKERVPIKFCRTMPKVEKP